MVDSVVFILTGIVVPHAGINDDLGVSRSVNGISVVIYKDFTAIILFRCAEDIIAGADFTRRIFNEVIFIQRGFFYQIHPCSRVAVICSVKAVRCGSRKIQRIAIDCEMPFAFVGARPGCCFDFRNRDPVIDQRHIVAVYAEIFFRSIHRRLYIVVIFAGGFERPLLNIATFRDQKDTFVM